MLTTWIEPTTLQRFDRATHYEWLETNGLGGYASSTVIGANTRRYHGLLVAATKPPVGRQVLLSKLDEALLINGHRYELGTNKYAGAVYPEGYIFLESFHKDLFPVFTYRINGLRLRKTLAAVQGENTLLIHYEVLAASEPVTMEMVPLVAFRDYHALRHAAAEWSPVGLFDPQTDEMTYQPETGHPVLHLQVPGGHFDPRPDWYFNFEYSEELARGMDGHEDLYRPGIFYRQLEAGDSFTVIASDQPTAGRNGQALFEQEKNRRLDLLSAIPTHPSFIQRLTLAADQFVVKRGDDLKTIIAGYPWFSDWGRDTMIALPGLCLATGRFEDARKILAAFAENVDQGMIPNRFPDGGEAPLYNTIDASLWFFVAIFKYYQATRDMGFVQSLLPVLEDMLAWHERGTRFGICVAEDGLLSGGEAGTQLTWMDAKVGDWVVTPRRGKAVEINALWYNAWEILGALQHEIGDPRRGAKLRERARHIRQVFFRTFWNQEKGYLNDYVTPDEVNDALRPNQIFALSLPFTLLDQPEAQQVLNQVERTLYTPIGLRSLSPFDPAYQPVYHGDQYARDGAYHQGTVWSWLLGPYIDATIRVRGALGKELAKRMLGAFESHLDQAGIGTVSEIFDGDSPWQPRGCYAQAWGVAELLRVYSEHQLLNAPTPPAARIYEHKRQPFSQGQEQWL